MICTSSVRSRGLPVSSHVAFFYRKCYKTRQHSLSRAISNQFFLFFFYSYEMLPTFGAMSSVEEVRYERGSLLPLGR